MQRSLVQTAPPAPQRLLPHCRAARLVVRAAAGESNLEPWQVNKLQHALLAGRRQVKVEKLCKELGVERGTVLQWLKDAPTPDPAQRSLLEARAAAEEAAQERRVVLQQGRQQHAAGSSGGGRSAAAGAGGGRGGVPAWRSYSKKKALGRQAEATLEMLFSRTQWPSDEAVNSLWDLHRLPRDKVVDWFKQRRQQEQAEMRAAGGRGKGRGSGGAGSTASGSSGGGTDLDAAWDDE